MNAPPGNSGGAVSGAAPCALAALMKPNSSTNVSDAMVKQKLRMNPFLSRKTQIRIAVRRARKGKNQILRTVVEALGGTGGEAAMTVLFVNCSCLPRSAAVKASASVATKFCSLTLAVSTAGCVPDWIFSQQE